MYSKYHDIKYFIFFNLRAKGYLKQPFHTTSLTCMFFISLFFLVAKDYILCYILCVCLKIFLKLLLLSDLFLTDI